MSSSDEFESAEENELKTSKISVKKAKCIKKATESKVNVKDAKITDLENNTDDDEIVTKTDEISHKNESDNWSDFGEEWGDEEVVAIEKNDKRTNNQKIFEESSNENFSSCKGNTLSSVSNYDAFPVLNELSHPKKIIPPPAAAETMKHNETNLVGDTKEKSSWSNWKPSWGGVSSFISTASQGISTVIENSIGIPDPEQLARINIEEGKPKSPKKDRNSIVEDITDNVHGNQTNRKSSKSSSEETFIPKFGNLVTGVTNIGSKVISGGLDTLEGIGKKTMTILQENDPLLLNKRKMLGLEKEKPVLSQVLREAKEKSEEMENNLKQMQKQSYKKQLHFESLFDNYYGLVHLEALELISKQSSIKLQSLMDPLSGKALLEMQETLNEVKEICDLGDIENDNIDRAFESSDLEEKLQSAIEDLGIETDFKDIVCCFNKTVEFLNKSDQVEPQELYEKGLHCVAEMCALSICKMHKIGEILLIKEHHSTANEADSLVQLTHAFCFQINIVANKFCEKLNTYEATEETKSLVTSIFLEVYNSTTFIQNAFHLFIPILQIGAA